MDSTGKRRRWAGWAIAGVVTLACWHLSGVSSGATTTDPFAEPLALVAQARAVYATVRDYSCLFIKRETVNGVLTPNHVIAMRVRTAPFSVSLQWQEPKDLAGQEVCFVAGRNGNRLRVRSSGLLGSVGFVSLAQDDPRVLRSSPHRITDAGIGHVIDKAAAGWPLERQWGQTQVHVGTYQFARHQVRRVEMIHPTYNPRFEHFRNVVYFDEQTHLPIRVENYAWPRRAGDAGDLAEVFSYVNLRINAGVPPELFNR